MKTMIIKTLLVASVLLCYGSLHAQNSSTKPDQLKLIKQFVGQWKASIGQDTALTAEFAAIGNGLEGRSTMKSGSETLNEVRQMFGYDPKTDTFIEAELSSVSDIELWACWFSSDNLFVGVPIADLSDPSKAIFRVEVRIQSPDCFVQTIFKNDKIMAEKTMKKVTDN
jgi:hypothetical protein